MLVILQLVSWVPSLYSMDPRIIGTQIDDSLMNLRAKLILMDKSYLLNVKSKVLDGRIFITGKVDTVEEKLKITKLGWEKRCKVC